MDTSFIPEFVLLDTIVIILVHKSLFTSQIILSYIPGNRTVR